jgi:hypothetical protein
MARPASLLELSVATIMLAAGLLVCPRGLAASGSESRHGPELRDVANAARASHPSRDPEAFVVEHPSSDFVFDSCDGSVVRKATIVFHLTSLSGSGGGVREPLLDPSFPSVPRVAPACPPTVSARAILTGSVPSTAAWVGVVRAWCAEESMPAGEIDRCGAAVPASMHATELAASMAIALPSQVRPGRGPHLAHPTANALVQRDRAGA